MTSSVENTRLEISLSLSSARILAVLLWGFHTDVADLNPSQTILDLSPPNSINIESYPAGPMLHHLVLILQFNAQLKLTISGIPTPHRACLQQNKSEVLNALCSNETTRPLPLIKSVLVLYHISRCMHKVLPDT
jgi:hypothetical protein